MKRFRLLLLPALFSLLNLCTRAQARPNIIYILADDLGYGDLGCYGQQQIRTPHIDALAASGIRFTRHYAGAPVCAPSRAVLMTGRDIGHARVRGNYESGPNGFGAGLALRREDFTVAELLKQRGYRTALIGKWGLGVTGTSGEPNKKGFDYSYGFLNQGHAHYQFPDHLFRDGKRVEIPENRSEGRKLYSNDLFTNDALNFLKENGSKPFFLYLAYTTPHAELLVPQDSIFASYAGRFQEKPFVNKQSISLSDYHGSYHSQSQPKAAYAACITHLDRCIGKLVEYLKEKGLYENTLILFSSDNGPAREGGADPAYFNSSGGLRGMKRDVYEGGIRVPMIAHWPGAIKAGRETDLISGFQDVLPTLAEVTGKPLDKKIATEGVSFYATLTGRTADQKLHRGLYWEFHENPTSSQAILMGNWKAVRQAPNDPIELYDLDTDPAEQHNVAVDHAELVNRFREAFANARTPHPVWPLKMRK